MSLFKTNTTQDNSKSKHVKTVYGGGKNQRKRLDNKAIRAIKDKKNQWNCFEQGKDYYKPTNQ